MPGSLAEPPVPPVRLQPLTRHRVARPYLDSAARLVD